MIIVITYMDEKTKTRLVSHGVDAETLENIILPQVSPKEVNAFFDYEIGEYVIL